MIYCCLCFFWCAAVWLVFLCCCVCVRVLRIRSCVLFVMYCVMLYVVCVSLCVVLLLKLYVRVVCGLLRWCAVCDLFACFVVCLCLCVFGRFMCLCVLFEADRVMLYGVVFL